MVYLSFITDGVKEQWQQQPPKIGKLESYKARKLKKLEIWRIGYFDIPNTPLILLNTISDTSDQY